MKPGIRAFILTVISRDLLLLMRGKADAANSILFFVLVASLFPLGIGTDANLLRAIGPGIVWVCALLASMLALVRLFAADYADGNLEQLALAPYPFGLAITGKVIAHWIATGLPLVLIAPIIGLQFGLPGDALSMLSISLALGTPVLSVLGAIAAALTLGLRSAGALVSLLVLPLCVPVLIFGSGAVEASAAGMDAAPNLLLLAAYLLPSLLFGPWLAALAIRIALE